MSAYLIVWHRGGQPTKVIESAPTSTQTIHDQTTDDRAGRGGHFAAWKEPALVADDLRGSFGGLMTGRSAS